MPFQSLSQIQNNLILVQNCVPGICCAASFRWWVQRPVERLRSIWSIYSSAAHLKQQPESLETSASPWSPWHFRAPPCLILQRLSKGLPSVPEKSSNSERCGGLGSLGSSVPNRISIHSLGAQTASPGPTSVPNEFRLKHIETYWNPILYQIDGLKIWNSVVMLWW